LNVSKCNGKQGSALVFCVSFVEAYNQGGMNKERGKRDVPR